MKLLKKLVLILFTFSLLGCIDEDNEFYGYISYYGDEFAGNRTASGGIFDTNKYTCASRTLPFRTILEVMNTENNKTVIVMVNDRGPYVENRILDISKRSTQRIDMIEKGVIFAKIKILKRGNGTFSEEDYNNMIREYY